MKTIPPRVRGVVLAALFAGAAWLAVFGDKTPQVSATEPVAKAVVRPQASSNAPTDSRTVGARPAAVQATGQLAQLEARDTLIRPASRSAPVDIFSPRNWTPPPPPPPPPPAPPPPTAPPLPYVYLGKKLEAGQWEIYMGRGDMTFIVHQGDRLESDYQIASIAPPAMTLVYLPLGQRQSFFIGE